MRARWFLMRARWFRRMAAVGVLAAAVVIPVSPASAEGDPPAALARFYDQALDWKPCGDPALDGAGAQCAGVRVPLDYGRPDGRTTTVAISRIPATDPARRRGIMLSNPGGPGGPGLSMMVTVRDRLTPDVRAQYDLIGMDPRGIGRSDRVHCAIPLPTMLFSAGFDVFGYARDTALAGALAASCIAPDPDKARHTTTRNIARDMDVIRGAFGDERVNYYGGSYGSYLGGVYLQMFGRHADRFVLDSGVDDERYWLGMFQDMGGTNEAALDDWSIWAARHDGDHHFGATPPQVRGYVENLVRRAAGHPVFSDGYLIDEHTVPMMMLSLLANPKLDADLADVLRIVDDAVSGRPFDMKTLKAKITAAVPTEASGMAAIMCGDKAAPRDPAWYYRNIEAIRAAQPVFGAFANNITACAYWPDPVEPPTEMNNANQALILGTIHDTRTAYTQSLALHRDLTASRLVTLANTRIHGAFRVGLSPCVSDIVNTYFDDGTLPAADLTCEPDPSYFPE
ncbi:alpha/beta fold hydrolase [Nocardia sp. BMG51109]|uniref:alpha/beta fold hydrolase n=1 Tax=Nocardia sp. BMG51109 TaxID=1056816 RepID=UPI0004646752|nr:alpha/beta fold hydrolase [Nocardia sp. BMG51109]